MGRVAREMVEKSGINVDELLGLLTGGPGPHGDDQGVTQGKGRPAAVSAGGYPDPPGAGGRLQADPGGARIRSPRLPAGIGFLSGWHGRFRRSGTG